MTMKKFVACIVSAAIILSAVALAAETGTVVSSETGGEPVPADVFSVALPVVSRSATTTFDFILDPQRLIEHTAAARFDGGLSFDWGTLYFANLNTDGSVRGYSSTSDFLTITNRSTVAVDVTLQASLRVPEGISLTSDPDFYRDTSTSLYMALSDSGNTAAITAGGATLTAVLPAAADDAYEVVHDAVTGYSYYVLSDAAQAPDYAGFPSYRFYLTGACNPAGDWFALYESSPTISSTVTVVWTVAPAEPMQAAIPSGTDIAGVTEAQPEADAGLESETAPETQPEVSPETQPEVTPEVQPETQPEVTPETKPETQPEATPETEPETQPEVTPETQPETQPEATPETEPETQPEATPETPPEVSPETQPETPPETETTPETESSPEASTLPGIAGTTYVLTAGVGLSMPVELGSGTQAAADVSSVVFTTAGGAAIQAAYHFDAGTGVLSIDSTVVEELIAAGAAACTVTFDNGSSVSVAVTAG